MTDQATDTAAEEAQASDAAASGEQPTNTAEAEDLLGDETPEAKADGEKGDKDSAEKPDAKGDGEGEAGAPEEYEPFVLPEGVDRDEAGLEAFGTLAKEFNLPQEAAQKLVDLQAEVVQRNADAAWQVWADKQNEWAKEVRNDKEFGGEHVDASKVAAKAFVTKFGGSEEEAGAALEVLRLTGASNHPAVFKMLARAGKELAEDVIVSGTQGGGEPAPRANIMFPDQN